MADREFVVARNPDPDSTLPYLIRLPLASGAVVLKARDTWPRTAKVFCHPETVWPDEPEIVESVPIRSCVRRGAAIDLILDRSRENRSQVVFARARGRDMIFWQSARTAKQARPAVGLPSKRSPAGILTILIDSRERYPWRFAHQQAEVRRQALPCGDYAVELDGDIVASVERKTLADLSSSLVSGKLRYTMADLGSLGRAAVVVEDRYSAVFKLKHVRPSVVADALAEAQVRQPAVPIIFCETRALAEEWTYRFLGAALADAHGRGAADELAAGLASADGADEA